MALGINIPGHIQRGCLVYHLVSLSTEEGSPFVSTKKLGPPGPPLWLRIALALPYLHLLKD